MSRIIYNDGEGIVPGDFNIQQDLERRRLFDSILWNMAAHESYPGYSEGFVDNTWTPGSNYGSLIRPLRTAGAVQRINDTSLRIEGGLFLQESTAALDPDNNVALVAAVPAPVTLDLTGLAAGVGTFRRDLVECRIVLGGAAQETRDFKDAVTGARTTQLVDKRRDLTVEFQLVTGTEGTLAASANADNLPANTAGWSVIAAILFDDGGLHGTKRYIWDYRRPWGRWSATTLPQQMYEDSTWFLTIGGGGSGMAMRCDNLNEILIIPGPWNIGKEIMGSPQQFDGFRNMRVDRITMLADFFSSITANKINLYSHRAMFDNFSIASFGSDAYPGADGDAGDGDVGFGRVSTFASAHTMYWDQFYSDDPPLWSNGMPSPFLDFGVELPEELKIVLTSTTGTDYVYGVEWQGWGGF